MVNPNVARLVDPFNKECFDILAPANADGIMYTAPDKYENEAINALRIILRLLHHDDTVGEVLNQSHKELAYMALFARDFGIVDHDIMQLFFRTWDSRMGQGIRMGRIDNISDRLRLLFVFKTFGSKERYRKIYGDWLCSANGTELGCMTKDQVDYWNMPKTIYYSLGGTIGKSLW
jgi:hypothetical protein